MSLWDWTLKAYSRPGVPEICLGLQDDHGLNTSVLLWAAWARTAEPALLADACDLAKAWDAAVLVPLREVRKTLKPDFPPVADADRLGLREDVKAAELRAERVLMETLKALGDAAGPARGEAAALDALRAAAKAWGAAPPDGALAALDRALG